MRARDRRRLGLLTARELGHRVSGWMPDVCDGSYLAQCEGCDRYMALDRDGSPMPFGYLLRERCTGRRMP